MQLSLREVAGILGASGGVPDRLVLGYSIDSRTIGPGQLFFAVKGPRFDGHQFVQQAFDRGAAGAVVQQGFEREAPSSIASSLIPASDTTRALQAVALAVRRKWGRRVVAITGSTGKTTTKEMIATLLAQQFTVHKSPGNLNNQYGLPLTLLGLEPGHQVAVLELAMAASGEIADLARLAEPEVGVVTNVAPVHLQFFDSVDSIARAKRELIENLKRPAVAVLNWDDPRVRRFSEGFDGQVVTFGFKEGAEFRAAHIETQGAGTRFRMESSGFVGDFQIPLPGRHNVANALAALATASLSDIAPERLREALATFKNLHQRSEILTLSGGITIINDCYNSNPLAMERMLETLATWPEARRRIVVAGEMLELGPSSPDLHRMIGAQCAECQIDWLLAVQGDARFFVEGAVAGGLASERARFFPNATESGEFCRKLIEPSDLVLVKGSRGVHLEAVTELLVSQGKGTPGGSPALPAGGRSKVVN